MNEKAFKLNVTGAFIHKIIIFKFHYDIQPKPIKIYTIQKFNNNKVYKFSCNKSNSLGTRKFKTNKRKISKFNRKFSIIIMDISAQYPNIFNNFHSNIRCIPLKKYKWKQHNDFIFSLLPNFPNRFSQMFLQKENFSKKNIKKLFGKCVVNNKK